MYCVNAAVRGDITSRWTTSFHKMFRCDVLKRLTTYQCIPLYFFYTDLVCIQLVVQVAQISDHRAVSSYLILQFHMVIGSDSRVTGQQYFICNPPPCKHCRSRQQFSPKETAPDKIKLLLVRTSSYIALSKYIPWLVELAVLDCANLIIWTPLLQSRVVNACLSQTADTAWLRNPCSSGQFAIDLL
jgi:hypothetical protein